MREATVLDQLQWKRRRFQYARDLWAIEQAKCVLSGIEN